MAILTVDGIPLHDPSDFTVDRFDLSSAGTGRTLTGRMVKDIVARKVRLNCKWSTLDWDKTKVIFNAIEGKITFRVRYPDPKEGYVTKIMYVGDRTAPAVSLVNGKEYWNGISFELIEE